MVGSYWHNFLGATILSVYVFLLSLLNNTPQASIERALLTFIISLILIQLMRWGVTYITKKNHQQNINKHNSSNENPDYNESDVELDVEETANHVRTMMNEEQLER
ncbi:hypothetical protein GCM10008935_16100 [Alkalibacillus silvisoli]|uniref:Uncharacterized protein n=2 Tax=Alkalibacillus silvisoli TaxID=392823 RepID=A0ABN0ZWM0_9BACI